MGTFTISEDPDKFHKGLHCLLRTEIHHNSENSAGDPFKYKMLAIPYLFKFIRNKGLKDMINDFNLFEPRRAQSHSGLSD